MTSIDYYFSLSSPFSYLGHPTLVEIARRHHVPIRYRPAEFRRIFAATGGLPLHQRPPARQAYRLRELKRWSARRGLPIVLHPRHHFGPRELPSGVVIAAQRMGIDCDQLAFRIMRACWAEERDIADRGVLAGIVGELQLEPSIMEVAESSEVAAEFARNTDEALARNVFGAPTYFYGDDMFWGQDRLDFLEEAIQLDKGKP